MTESGLAIIFCTGTPLTMGINPRGLYIYRLGQTAHPVVKFSWAECSELSYTEKKFKIEVCCTPSHRLWSGWRSSPEC